jgi:hypothetical protein
MEQFFLYENFSHLEKNSPQHQSVDNLYKDCELFLKVVRISLETIIDKKPPLLLATAICPRHGITTFLVRFKK